MGGCAHQCACTRVASDTRQAAADPVNDEMIVDCLYVITYHTMPGMAGYAWSTSTAIMCSLDGTILAPGLNNFAFACLMSGTMPSPRP